MNLKVKKKTLQSSLDKAVALQQAGELDSAEKLFKQVLASQSLEMGYRIENFDEAYVQKFDDAFFQNIEGYNRLLVSVVFYERYG